MISTTCSLKGVNELQHQILSQLIIRSTLGITLAQPIRHDARRSDRTATLLQEYVNNKQVIESNSETQKGKMNMTFTF